MKNKLLIIASSFLALLIIFFLGRYFFQTQEKKRADFLASENAQVFIRDYAMTMGSSEAKVHLTEFLDPECESCRALHPFVKGLLKKYEGKLRLIIRYAPFHGNSKMVVQILEAARMQGKYEETLELLFHYQPAWGSHHDPRPDLIWNYLGLIEGLDIEKLRTDMNAPSIQKIIEQDILDGEKLEVRKTPTFFVNGKPLENFGLEPLEKLIEDEIKLFY
jgi:protein-disulfide isomerase